MKNKLMNFVSQLSDNEIDEQLNDIFGWAKVYQELLLEEKRSRHNNLSNHSETTVHETFAEEPPENANLCESNLEPVEKTTGVSDMNNRAADDIKGLDSDELFKRYQNERDWTVEYRYLCYAEWLKRQESGQDLCSRPQVSDISIDYWVAQQIQDTVAKLSLEQTKERLIKLQQIPQYNLTDEELAELEFVKETCRIHVEELTSNV